MAGFVERIECSVNNLRSHLLLRDVVAEGMVVEYGSVALARHQAKIEKKRAYTEWGVEFWGDVIKELDLMRK